ncbi:hypothetical protein PSEUBRA_002202 [Kalmanozyma brasiliensis GHG001]|uniref:uncharacterized protein n=1 Tax=Kalmanozyma brasiliensis (strain GHG001) TaxID=1365824 RepID=UPI002867B93A|nr:uncharacterized protein PSEUBRA_002202 [Kalmanozyma brasiliensis GHG001]KAF6767056.1 hypothetical protein PSEUBRA_002202 [Kalmanozyma brasiliensis GHG001]
MGSCMSTTKTFQGEGRTLNEPPSTRPATAVDAGAGRRLGSSSSTAPTSSHAPPASSTSDADREARARAAEQRMKQQAAKGAPTQGKLSRQLQEQQATNPLDPKNRQEEPQRVVFD